MKPKTKEQELRWLLSLQDSPSALENDEGHHLRTKSCKEHTKLHSNDSVESQLESLRRGQERVTVIEMELSHWILAGAKPPPNFPLEVAPWEETVRDYEKDCLHWAVENAYHGYLEEFASARDTIIVLAAKKPVHKGVKRAGYINYALRSRMHAFVDATPLDGSKSVKAVMIECLQKEVADLKQPKSELATALLKDEALFSAWSQEQGKVLSFEQIHQGVTTSRARHQIGCAVVSVYGSAFDGLEDKPEANLQRIDASKRQEDYLLALADKQRDALKKGQRNLALIESEVSRWVKAGVPAPTNYPLKIAPWPLTVQDYGLDCITRAMVHPEICLGPEYVEARDRLIAKAAERGFPEELHFSERKGYVEHVILNKLRCGASPFYMVDGLPSGENLANYLDKQDPDFADPKSYWAPRNSLSGINPTHEFGSSSRLLPWRAFHDRPAGSSLTPEEQAQRKVGAGQPQSASIPQAVAGARSITTDFWAQSMKSDRLEARPDLSFLSDRYKVVINSPNDEQMQALALRFVDEMKLDEPTKNLLKLSLPTGWNVEKRLLSEHLLDEMRIAGMSREEICQVSGLDAFDSLIINMDDRPDHGSTFQSDAVSVNAQQLGMVWDDPERSEPGKPMR